MCVISGRVCPAASTAPPFPPPPGEEQPEDDDQEQPEQDDREQPEDETAPTSPPTTTATTAATSPDSTSTETTEATTVTPQDDVTAGGERVPRPEQEQPIDVTDHGDVISSVTYIGTVSACALVTVGLLALLVASYRGRFKAWLWRRRYVKKRSSPPPTSSNTVFTVENISSLPPAASPADLVADTSSMEDETLFEGPPRIMVHQQRDGSSPAALATPPDVRPKTSSGKRKKAVKGVALTERRRSPRFVKQE